MCTAINDGGFFGRTLDLEFSYSEAAVIAPRRFEFRFLYEGANSNHSAVIGISHVSGGYPLFYDAANEAGLCMAALNFPGNAVYFNPDKKKRNLASFELIPWVLSNCDSVADARKMLYEVNVTDANFSGDLPATPLHWMIGDREGSIAVESVTEGLKIYDNPFGVLTNNPPYPFHVANVSNYMSLTSAPPENKLCPEIELNEYSRGMGAIGLPGDFSSASRFVRALYVRVNTSQGGVSGHERFYHIMDTVKVPKGCIKTHNNKDVHTVYASCFDMEKKRYYFSKYQDRAIKYLDLNGFCLDRDELVCQIV